jgi:hypothetical protein
MDIECECTCLGGLLSLTLIDVLSVAKAKPPVQLTDFFLSGIIPSSR